MHITIAKKPNFALTTLILASSTPYYFISAVPMSSLQSSKSSPLVSTKINESPNGPNVPSDDPLAPLSSVMHTINSVYRYPQWLSRHPQTSLDKIESDLMSYVNEFKRQKERAEKRWREVEETGKTFEEQIGGLIHNGELFPEVSESGIVTRILYSRIHAHFSHVYIP